MAYPKCIALRWPVGLDYDQEGVRYMNIRNCRMCGHIFNYVAGPFLCPHCREKMEAKFQEVKEYIRANPGVGIQDVAENCDVEPSQIQQWLREERLELTEGSVICCSVRNAEHRSAAEDFAKNVSMIWPWISRVCCPKACAPQNTRII